MGILIVREVLFAAASKVSFGTYWRHRCFGKSSEVFHNLPEIDAQFLYCLAQRDFQCGVSTLP